MNISTSSSVPWDPFLFSLFLDLSFPSQMVRSGSWCFSCINLLIFLVFFYATRVPCPCPCRKPPHILPVPVSLIEPLMWASLPRCLFVPRVPISCVMSPSSFWLAPLFHYWSVPLCRYLSRSAQAPYPSIGHPQRLCHPQLHQCALSFQKERKNVYLSFLLFVLRKGLFTWPRLSWNSLCTPGYHWTHRDLPASASWMLELKVWATTPQPLIGVCLFVLMMYHFVAECFCSIFLVCMQ